MNETFSVDPTGTPILGSASTPSAAQADGEALSLTWVEPPGMIGLSIKNFLYRLITLGVYNFWGKTEVRKRIWAAMRINGEPLQYTGTGKEMFLGFLFILAALTIPTLLLGFLAAILLGPTGAQILQLPISIFFAYLVGVGTHRAIRYRLSRTQWRGIRGGLEGSAWNYGWTYFWTGIVLVLTLTWASPWRTTKLQSLIVNGMRFGNRPFHFDARSGPLYGPFLALWLSSVAILLATAYCFYLLIQPYFGSLTRPGQPPDVGSLMTILLAFYGVLFFGMLLYALASAWYRAQIINHFAAHTTFEGARFSGTATGRSLVWLSISNALILVAGGIVGGIVVGAVVGVGFWLASLVGLAGPLRSELWTAVPGLLLIGTIMMMGLLAPVAQARSARYFIERLQLSGSANLDQVLQGAAASGRGEGLAQAFDIDAF